MKFGIEIVLNEDAELFLGGFRCFFKNQLLGVCSKCPCVHTCMHAHHAPPSVQGRACSGTYIGSRKCFLLLLSSSFNAMGRECKLACFVNGLSRCAPAGWVADVPLASTQTRLFCERSKQTCYCSGVGRSRSGDAVYHLFCLLRHWIFRLNTW